MNDFKKIMAIVGICWFLIGLLGVSLVHAEASRNFVMKDLAGKEHRLADYQGKWVLVNYWATWCPSCLDEMPDFLSMYEQRKTRDLVVLGIAVDYKNEREVRHFVDDMLISYPIILGTPKIFAQFGNPQVLPTTLIYNPQGKLVKVKRGLVTKQSIELLMVSPPNDSLDISVP